MLPIVPEGRIVSSVDEIIRSVPITKVWAALGGGPLKGEGHKKRGAAFWRKGENKTSVSVDVDEGLWIDFRDNRGGGVLHLIQTVFGCDRAAAVQWLANYTGVKLEARTPTPKHVFKAAQREGEAFYFWLKDLDHLIWTQRDQLIRTYHNARRFILSHDIGDLLDRGDFRFYLAESILVHYWEQILEFDDRLDFLQDSANYDTLLAEFRKTRRRAA